MGEQVAELLLTTVGEFRGKPPDIPLPGDINVEELTGGADPFFVTLPIMKVGAKSQNRSQTASGKKVSRVYGRDAAKALVNHINRERPGGAMGHPEMSGSFRSTLPNAVQWLAAEIHDDTVWGKMYVLNHRQDLRDDMRVRMAANSKIATSIYGTIGAIQETGEVNDLEPRYVDIADPYEAGVADLAARPLVTKEIKDDEMEINEIQEKLEAEQQKLADAVKTISEQQGQIAELKRNTQIVGEIRKSIGATEDNQIISELTALVKEVKQLRKKTMLPEMEGLLNEWDLFKNSDAARELAREVLGIKVTDNGTEIIAEIFPESINDAREAVLEWMKRPTVQQMMRALVVAEQGPSAFVAGVHNGGHRAVLEDTPENRANARRKFGI